MPKIGYIELASRADGGPIDLDHFKRKSWPGITAECARIGPTSYDYALRPTSSFVVALNIYRADGETLAEGHPRATAKDLRNKLTYIPEGNLLSGWSQLAKPGTYTAVYFNQAKKEEDEAKLRNIPPMLHFNDQMLRSSITALGNILRDFSYDFDGYAETIGTLLTFELSRVNLQANAFLNSESGLSPRQMQRVVDYIESNLTERIAIADLAAVAELSRFHLIRAFKKSCGVPPYQFIMRRRVDRAKELLADQRVSVTEVALNAGFNGLAQLTRAFRHVVGVTPTDFRRDRK